MTDPKILAESGVLLVDKPTDWTSHDVVNCVRKRFRIRKVGHCGTLDPGATGLLVLVLGKATKLSRRLSSQGKEYIGTMRLGEETDTQDADGRLCAEGSLENVTEAEVRSAAEAFVGDIEQIPPMTSAVKKGGRRLYKLARQGIEVEREARPVTVHEFGIDDVHFPDVDFHVRCSKGTYIRTLCADIGSRLGCGAHMLRLRRTRSGLFDVENAYSMQTIKKWERDDVMAAKIDLSDILDHLQ